VSQQINLFSPVFLTPKVYFSSRAMLEALALLMVGLAVLYGFLLNQTRDLERQRAVSDRLLQAEQARLADSTKRLGPRSASVLLQQEIARLESSLADRGAILRILSEESAGQQFSSFLRALASQRQRGVWLTGIEVDRGGAGLSLSGRAIGTDNVPRYIAKLNHEPLLRGRDFIALKLQASVPEKTEDPTSTLRAIDFQLEAKPAQEVAQAADRGQQR
jgi:hypothetical protein